MFVRGGRLALALVAVVLVVTGCGGGGSKPVSLPTLPPTSTSPTPTATATDSAVAGALAAVRAYYAVVNNFRVRMDPAALAGLMSKDCTCRAQVKAVAAAAAHGEHYIDHARLTSLTPAVNSPTSVDVLVEYDASEGGLVDAAGHRLTTAPATRGVRRLFHLRKMGGAWRIVEIDAA